MNKTTQQLNTPIAFIIFNRPDTTQKVFNEIKKIKPKKLFVIADGARNDKEWEECDKTREIINQVDWNCEIHKNYSDINLGCKIRVSSGIDWFFENVEEGIILEDDCVPHQSFFRYCEELLEKYRDNNRIMCITGDNFQNGIKRGNHSYYFSIYNHCWGWATWKKSWQHFDIKMKDFPKFKKNNSIKKLFDKKIEQKYWLKIFQEVYENKINSWAYIWTYTCWNQKGLTCLPNLNLVSNIGFDKRGTHTTNKDDKHSKIPNKNLTFPLSHPKKISINYKADKFTFKNSYLHKKSIRNKLKHLIMKHFPTRVKKIIKKILLPQLESIPNSPDYFKSYRYFNSHPKMKRFQGGWEYQGEKYPDYLFVGGASYAIFHKAQTLITGKGIDIGAGFWEFPGSIPIDLNRGEGKGNNLETIEENTLNYIFSSHCLEHIFEWKKELRNWKKLLKKGGRIFLYLPHPDCAIWLPQAPGIGDGHKWIPDLETIHNYILKLNMTIIDEHEGPDGMMSFYICAKKE